MEILRTERLTGRPPRPRDARFAAALLARPEVGAWTGEAGAPCPALAKAQAQAAAAHWAAHGFGLRVWQAGGAPVGLAGLRFCVQEGRAAVEAAFAVAPERWGEGLGGEVMAAVMAEAPAICTEVRAAVHDGNAAALALLRGLGFVETAAGAGRRRLLWRGGAG